MQFAAFVTTRERWSLLDGTGVDSDTADFGHGVVEIEAMPGSVEDLAACQDRVVAWMRRLRLTEAGGIRPPSAGRRQRSTREDEADSGEQVTRHAKCFS